MKQYNIISPAWRRSLLKATVWAAWNVGFGLMPFVITMFVAGILLPKNENSISNDEIRHLSNDCVILFFCSAMMAETTIEAFISKAKFNKYSYLGFCCTSFMVIGLVGNIYAVLVFGRYNFPAFNRMNNMSAFQTIIGIFSLLYSIYIKSKLLYEEDKNYQLCQSY